MPRPLPVETVSAEVEILRHPNREELEGDIAEGKSISYLVRVYQIPGTAIEKYRREYLKEHPEIVKQLIESIPEEQEETTGDTAFEKDEKRPAILTREKQERIILDTLNPLFVEKKARLKSPLPPIQITPLLKSRFREHCILLGVRVSTDPAVYRRELRKWATKQAELQARNEESRREALGVVAGDDTGIFPYWGSPSHISAFKEARKPPRDYFLERYNR